MHPYQFSKVSGPEPKFTDYHVWKALMSLDESSPSGRKKLAATLKIGEGSTRTLLSILTEQGLIQTDRKGVTLTDAGIKLKDAFFLETRMIETYDLTIGKYDCAVVLKHASKKITFGCEERDAAILADALGATTLVAVNGHLRFPGSDYPVDEKTESALKNEFIIRNDDAVIIGTADDPESAERGAISAALNVMGGLRLKRRIVETDTSTKQLLSLAFAVHELIGGFPVCAKTANDLGIRIENWTVIDNAYRGELLERAITEERTIRCVAPSGPYKGMSVIVSPIESNGKIIASIGVVDIQDILINAHP